MKKILLGAIAFLGIFLVFQTLKNNPPPTKAVNEVKKTINVAEVIEDYQKVIVNMSASGYGDIVVQKGIPVKLNLKAEEGEINGCNNSVVLPNFNVTKDLKTGDNWIEFTPNESGTFEYYCWMKMIGNKIIVVDDIQTYNSDTVATATASNANNQGASCH